MSNCTTVNDIEYCYDNKEWGVGKYNTPEIAYKGSNELINLVIPKSTPGISTISYIGRQAFDLIKTLKTVEIFADIRIFCDHCFANCPNLTRINIPSSTTTLNHNAIQCYTGKGASPGTLIIIIGVNSKLSSISSQSIAIKEQIHIYICDRLNVKYVSNSFIAANVTVFSPKKSTFCNIKTTRLQSSRFNHYCRLLTAKNPYCRSFLWLIFVLYQFYHFVFLNIN